MIGRCISASSANQHVERWDMKFFRAKQSYNFHSVLYKFDYVLIWFQCLISRTLQAWAPLGSLARPAGGRDDPGVWAGLLLAWRLHSVCLPNSDLHNPTQVGVTRQSVLVVSIFTPLDSLTLKTNVETFSPLSDWYHPTAWRTQMTFTGRRVTH